MGVIMRETYEIITPESSEKGDVEAQGFIDEEGTEYTFRELVELLRGTIPCNWYTHVDEPDLSSMVQENRSYHPVGERAERYAHKAWMVANATCFVWGRNEVYSI